MAEAATGASEAAGKLDADLLAIEPGEGSVGLRISAAAHPVSAVYGAAYLFLDRCWVLLDRPDADHVRVTLTPRGGASAGAQLDASALAAEFAEELVSGTWRAAIANETRSLIEAAISRAHAGGDAPPSLDELAGYEFSKDAMEDPLGIAASWEDKQKAAKQPREP
jgi:His-Xaa-Ser system protein HxsD